LTAGDPSLLRDGRKAVPPHLNASRTRWQRICPLRGAVFHPNGQTGPFRHSLRSVTLFPSLLTAPAVADEGSVCHVASGQALIPAVQLAVCDQGNEGPDLAQTRFAGALARSLVPGWDSSPARPGRAGQVPDQINNVRTSRAGDPPLFVLNAQTGCRNRSQEQRTSLILPGPLPSCSRLDIAVWL
jgi:hypothetical protein